MLYPGPLSVQTGRWVCRRTWCWSAWYTAVTRNSRRPSEHEWKRCLADGWSQNTKDVHRWNPLMPSWRINCWEITERRKKEKKNLRAEKTIFLFFNHLCSDVSRIIKKAVKSLAKLMDNLMSKRFLDSAEWKNYEAFVAQSSWRLND